MEVYSAVLNNKIIDSMLPKSAYILTKIDS